MRVLGGGAIGGHVIPALVRAGYTVSALARTADKAAWSRDQGAAPVSVSLFDRADLTIAFAGHEAVINLTSAMPSISRFLFARAFENNTRVRTDHGSRVLVPVVELPPDLAGPILGRALEPYRRSRLAVDTALTGPLVVRSRSAHGALNANAWVGRSCAAENDSPREACNLRGR